MMRISKLGTLALAGLLNVAPLGTHAQESTAVCDSSFAWMNNDEGLQPCLVAAYLIAPCLASPLDAFVLGLAASGIAAYSPPGPTEVYPASTCMCSSVLYSLLSACGVCQGFSNFDSWSKWIASCPAGMVSVGAYPDDFSFLVTVPQWAYQNVSIGNSFNVNTAEAIAAKSPPDVTASSLSLNTAGTAGSGSTTPPSITFSTPTYSIPTYSIPTYSIPTYSIPSITVPSITVPTFSVPTNNGSPDTFHVNSKKKTNVGAIVGGVIGGIAALLSAIAGVWLRIKRKARMAAASASAAVAAALDATSTPDPEKLQAHAPGVSPTGQPAEYFPTTLDVNPAPRLYDPDDPETYPDAQHFSNPALAGSSVSLSVPSHATPTNSNAGDYVPTQY